MIQRKQTIWLLLASLIILLTFMIPYGIHKELPLNSSVEIETDLTAKTNFILLSLTIACSAICFFTVFLYHNRKLQLKLCLLGVLLMLSTLSFQFYHATQTVSGNKIVVGILGSTLYLGTLIPVVGTFFLMLAYIGIRKDEKLVRDSDRLR